MEYINILVPTMMVVWKCSGLILVPGSFFGYIVWVQDNGPKYGSQYWAPPCVILLILWLVFWIGKGFNCAC